MTADGNMVWLWSPARATAGVRPCQRHHRIGLPIVAAMLSSLLAGSAAAQTAAPEPFGRSSQLIDPTFAPTLRHWPPSTVLERRWSPTGDVAHGMTAERSIERTARLDRATRLVQLDGFGPKVERELGAALAPVDELILDLRHNHGGSVRRMLRVAARFTGPVRDALRLIADDGATVLAIPAPHGPIWRGRVTVLVGHDTISSGEVLAALLRRYARAAVLGARTFGKDFAMRVVALDGGWRALEPAGRIEVPGEALRGGLLPDGPIPLALLARLDDRRRRAGQTRDLPTRPGATF